MKQEVSIFGLLGLSLLASAALGVSAPEPAPDLAPPPSPQRIVSLGLATDEILLELVEPSRVVALSFYADDEAASHVVVRARAVPHRLRPEAARLLALEPDVVIASPFAAPEVMRLVANSGVPICRVGFASSLDEVRASVRAVGACVGEAEGAEALVRAFDGRIAAVEARTRGRSRPEVLLYDGTGFASGEGTLFDDVAHAAGAANAARRLGRRGRARMPLATLLRLDPQVLVHHRYRAEARSRALVPEAPIDEDPRLNRLTAVREGRVVRLPPRTWLTTSHHVASSVERLFEALHGEAAP